VLLLKLPRQLKEMKNLEDQTGEVP